MPKIKQLLDQEPLPVIAIIKKITSANDFTLTNSNGIPLFELLLKETFENQQLSKLYQAWLKELASKYTKDDLKLDDILRKILNKKEVENIDTDAVLFLIRAGASLEGVDLVPLLSTQIPFPTAIVKELIYKHGLNVNELNNFLRNLLDHLRAQYGLDLTNRFLESIHSLLELGADINTQTTGGDTLLHILIRMASAVSPITLAIGHKLVSVTNKRSLLGILGEVLTLDDYWPIIAQLFRNNANINVGLTNYKNETIFSPLFRTNNFEGLMFLVRHGVHPDSILDDEGVPLLHYLVHSKQGFQARLIEELGEHGANLDIKDGEGNTARSLLQSNAKALNTFDTLNTISKGRPTRRNTQFANPQPTLPSPDLRKQNHQIALEAALDLIPLQMSEILRLISFGADPNTKNSNGDTALHLLIKSRINPQLDNSIRPMIQSLVKEYQADVSVEDDQRQTPLQLVLSQQSPDLKLAMFLVRAKADPNTCISDGTPLLHLVADRPHSNPSVRTLVENYHANIELTNRSGHSILDIAINKPQRDILAIGHYLKLGAQLKDWTWKKLTSETMITQAELSVLYKKDKIACGCLLNELLINKAPDQELSPQFYSVIKEYKECILDYIKYSFTAKGQVSVLLEALDPDSALGKLMWLKRGGLENGFFALLKHGWSNTNLNCGRLRECHILLERSVADIQFFDGEELPKSSRSDLLVSVLAHSTLPLATKHKITGKFSEAQKQAILDYATTHKNLSDFEHNKIVSALSIDTGEPRPA